MSNFLQCLDIGKEIFDKESLIVVHEHGQVDGSFVLHSLAAEFIRMQECDNKLLLILNYQSVTHWSSVASKLGWNLASNNKVSVVDSLKIVYDSITGHSIAEDDNMLDAAGNIDPNLLTAKSISAIHKLFPSGEKADDMTLSTTKPKKLLIILENFLTFSQNQDDCSRKKQSLEYLRRLRFERHDVDISLATLVHSTDEDMNQKYFCNILSESLATYSFHVSQLKTGFSSEVNGILKVAEYDRIFSLESNRKRRSSRFYHYKLLDRCVNFVLL